MLDKGLRKNIKKDKMEKLENKLNEMEALDMKQKKSETNQVKVKCHHVVQLFLNMAVHQKHIWSFEGKQKAVMGIFVFQKLR